MTRLNDPYEQTPEGFFLDNIAVGPNAQGRGLGRKLLELAESAALRRGERRMSRFEIERARNQFLAPSAFEHLVDPARVGERFLQQS